MAHSSPKEDAECAVCMSDITSESGLYVEYRLQDGGKWLPSQFCADCIDTLLQSQFKRYVDLLQTTTCKAEQRRLLQAGPPVNLKDKNGFMDENGQPFDAELHSLWFARDNSERPAKLVGSLEGEERLKFWEELKQFKIPDDAEE